MVYFPIEDLRLRQIAETEFIEAGDQEHFVPSYTLLFPSRTYAVEEIQDIVAESMLDAVLVISLTDAGANPYYVPRTTTNTGAGSITAGGYTVDHPWASFTAELVDARSDTSVWIASAESQGYQGMDLEDLLRSMARRTVTQLYRDGLVR